MDSVGTAKFNAKVIEQLQAANAKLKEELARYGGHHDNCTTEFGDFSCRKNTACECGWSQVEQSLKEKP